MTSKPLRIVMVCSISAMALVALPSCFRPTTLTEPFEVPQMRTTAAAEAIQVYFTQPRLEWMNQSLDGIIQIMPKPDKGLLIIRYDRNKITRVNIAHHIAKLGFDCNGVPGHAEAREKWPASWRQKE